MASAFTLICKIHAKREARSPTGNLLSKMYYLNDGVYGTFNCILYDHQHVTVDHFLVRLFISFYLLFFFLWIISTFFLRMMTLRIYPNLIPYYGVPLVMPWIRYVENKNFTGNGFYIFLGLREKIFKKTN